MTNRLTVLVARSFVARADSQNMRGKRRDTAALEFVCGAAAAAVALKGDASAEVHAMTSMAFLISLRGYGQLLDYANTPDDPAAVTLSDIADGRVAAALPKVTTLDAIFTEEENRKRLEYVAPEGSNSPATAKARAVGAAMAKALAGDDDGMQDVRDACEATDRRAQQG